MKIVNDFKKFAFKGNVIDMAVGVIIGGAFGKIVSSVVNDLLMPLIGVLLGGFDMTDLKWVIKPAADEAAELSLKYGSFIQTVVDFMIIAVSVFVFIRLAAKVMHKKEAEQPPPKKDDAVVLLEEIRDLLKKD